MNGASKPAKKGPVGICVPESVAGVLDNSWQPGDNIRKTVRAKDIFNPNGGCMRQLITTRYSLAALVAALFLFVACGGEEGRASKAAPDFSLEALSGERISLSDYRGSVVLVDFWATWCPPCRQSIPELIKLQTRYRDKGLVILGISLDDPRMLNDDALQAFVREAGINYTILWADQQVAMDFLGDGQVAIPTMFLVDRSGNIVQKHEGFRPGMLEESLVKHLS